MARIPPEAVNRALRFLKDRFDNDGSIADERHVAEATGLRLSEAVDLIDVLALTRLVELQPNPLHAERWVWRVTHRGEDRLADAA